jgi:hypothetical protein
MKINYSLLSRAKVKSAWGYTSAPYVLSWHVYEQPDLLLNQQHTILWQEFARFSSFQYEV